MTSFRVLAQALALLGAPILSFGFPFVFTASGTGNGGNAVSAQADFEIVTVSPGNYQLQVTLTNTAANVGRQQADFLSGVFFNITGNTALTRVSATAEALVRANGTVLSTNTNIGTHFSYRGGGGTLAYGARQGISAAGLGLFSRNNLFQDPGGPTNQPNGADYLIVPTAGITNPSNGNRNNEPFVRHSATFVLGGLTNANAEITNVTFQYGTSLSEGHLTGELQPNDPPPSVPEIDPTFAGNGIAMLAGIAFLAFGRRKAV